MEMKGLWITYKNQQMFQNYLKIALRKLLRQKLYTAVNILGLSVGICTCIALYVIISFELSFDRFHLGKERIYRVMADVTESTGDKLHFGRVPVSLSGVGRPVLSGVETMAAIIPYNAKIRVLDRDIHTMFFESRVGETHFLSTVLAEPQYFDIFRYEWLAGNARNALAAPYQVVLTEDRARQYFGPGPLSQIIGKRVIYQDSLTTTVSGIVKDWDQKTDLAFTDFISYSSLQHHFLQRTIRQEGWEQGDLSAWVFTKLSKGIGSRQVNAQLQRLVSIHGNRATNLSLFLEPLSTLHFNSDIIENPVRTAHMPTLYSLIGIAGFILLLAIINFINLSTAQSIQRAKEVGVRKVLGSSRSGLIVQFLSETFLLTLFSAVLAISFVPAVLSAFRAFIPGEISFHFFDPSMILFIGILIIVVSIFAGFFPAKVLSSFRPAQSLKGMEEQRGGQGWWLRKGLIVFQFSVSLVFIIASIVIANQLRYTRQKDLGFSFQSIITAETPRGQGYPKVVIAAKKIAQLPGVSQVALQWVTPMTDNARGMKLKYKSTDVKDFWVTQVAGNEDYIPLYQIRLLAGRNLVPSDSVQEFVINESLSKMLGNKRPHESLGRILYWNDQPYPVVGVVADFHTSSLRDPITPLCIINRPDRESSLAIKLLSTASGTTMINSTLSRIEKAYQEIYPDAPFTYRFYDESLAQLYEKDRQTATLVNVSMSIAIFISCIGLFGLSLFIARKKAKEISIRKILGATITHIVILLSRDFVLLVIIALFIASPIAWYLMNQWLQGFTYRSDISVWVFILAGAAAILIALLTVSFQAIKAAIRNPVKNMRNE